MSLFLRLYSYTTILFHLNEDLFIYINMINYNKGRPVNLKIKEIDLYKFN